MIVPLLALLVACGPTANPRYHLGAPYQAGGAWHYPAENFDLDETGLGATLSRPWGYRLTSNGEAYDTGAMAAAHATLQLPAIARLTNLENGLAVTVRINDRGTGNPRRLVEVTPRVASLLRMPSNTPVQMRLTVLGQESREALESLPGTPTLAIAVVPRGRIETADLAPPPGAGGQAGGSLAGTAQSASAVAQDTPQRARPTRLPEIVTQEAPKPGRLMVRLGTFDEYQYAMIQRARVAGLDPGVVEVWEGRSRRYRVELGPFGTVTAVETAQGQAMAYGVPDARIVVD